MLSNEPASWPTHLRLTWLRGSDAALVHLPPPVPRRDLISYYCSFLQVNHQLPVLRAQLIPVSVCFVPVPCSHPLLLISHRTLTEPPYLSSPSPLPLFPQLLESSLPSSLFWFLFPSLWQILLSFLDDSSATNNSLKILMFHINHAQVKGILTQPLLGHRQL